MLKTFDMKTCNAIFQKQFGSEEKNTCEEEIHLIPQDRIGNID